MEEVNEYGENGKYNDKKNCGGGGGVKKKFKYGFG